MQTMNNDRLENYIRDHRDEFDTLEPSEDMWNAIVARKEEMSEEETDVKQQPKRVQLNRSVYVRWISRIAAAVIIFFASYYYHDYQSNKEMIAESNTESNANSTLYNTLIEANYYYTSQINQEKEKLYSLTVGNSTLRKEIQNELDELDKEFNKLKEDLNDNVDNEEIIAAMIQNYRIKLSILQDVMTQLQDKNKVNTSDDETKRIEI